jgi:hypothetical protein
MRPYAESAYRHRQLLKLAVQDVYSDKGDLADLSFKGSRSGLALLASFKMEFRIPILSQEATVSVGEPRQRYFLQRYFLWK